MFGNRNEVSLYPTSFSTFDSLLDEVFNDDFFAPSKLNNLICSSSFPPADIYIDKGSNWHADIAVAGYSKDDIKASFKDNYLTLKLSHAENDDKFKDVALLQHGLKLPKEAEVRYFIDPRRYNGKQLSMKLENGLLKLVAPADVKKEMDDGLKIAFDE